MPIDPNDGAPTAGILVRYLVSCAVCSAPRTASGFYKTPNTSTAVLLTWILWIDWAVDCKSRVSHEYSSTCTHLARNVSFWPLAWSVYRLCERLGKHISRGRANLSGRAFNKAMV
ncbi:hypothetical protein PV10_03994 [Exophiala mesophila]|uniref:Uncharacterized protein n=1 Tax=Exophiala mesophila TaxID=212818 RepID=A0A0D2A0W7_EXOME|nr:uncharacterized protein PV10_03994 [Exophiala mesophila]KIV92723.1 hypothetical protein PV10_03994 [Exophiala mesophila]